ncbi:endo-13(4)-beta-glucanase 1-like, partial [Trifolium medium]|nr:endo-13(4)-beta-glucanase 1-like [Trifolium medium]
MRLFLTSSVHVILLVEMLFLEDHLVLSISGKRKVQYKSIDGDLVGIVGDTWLLKTDPISVTWHSTNGVKKEYHEEIVSALVKDVEDLNSSAITTTLSYFYGKLIARAA